MNSQDAMNYLTAIAEQRKVAREAIIIQIRKLSDFLKKNYRIGDLMCMPDGQLCVTLRALELQWDEQVELHKRNTKLTAQGMGPVFMILAIMIASCFAGCSASKNAARLERCPVFQSATGM